MATGVQISPFGTKTSVTSVLPVTCEVVITSDLPNGPYGEMAGMGGKMYIGEQSNYTDFANALIAAWNESRGSMLNMQVKQVGSVAGGKYTENWKVVGIKFKGGEVDPVGQVQAGPHNVSLGIIQATGVGCCVIM